MMQQPAPLHKKLKLSLVENDDGDAKVIRRTFEKAQIANPFIRFPNESEALPSPKCKDAHKPPRQFTVRSDINMPRMSGSELVRKLRDDPRLRKTLFFVPTTFDD